MSRPPVPPHGLETLSSYRTRGKSTVTISTAGTGFVTITLGDYSRPLLLTADEASNIATLLERAALDA